MSVAELTERVRAIAQSPKKRFLPIGIQTVLQRGIQARERCAEWYARSGANIASLQGHRHFIRVLQDALHSLKPHESGTDDGVNRKDDARVGLDLNKLNNQFEALHVEDIDDEEYPITATDISEPKPQAVTQREVYELDDHDADFENTFSLFCFFEDLHAIQTEIRKVWQRFADGHVDLKTATIITQAGIDMAKRLEKQQSGYCNSCGSKHPYFNLSMPVFYAEAIASGENPDELVNTAKGLEHRPFDDFIYLPTARTLVKFAQAAHACKDKVGWPFPVPPMRFTYIARPELLELPGYE